MSPQAGVLGEPPTVGPLGFITPARGEPLPEVPNTALSLQHPSVGLNPHEAIEELRQFLKVVCPHWSHYNRRGTAPIDKVMAKLKSIGVTDYWDFMHRVEMNTINEHLYAKGKVVFSDKTLDAFRHQKPFLAALEHLRAPSFRQAGVFAPVPQLHSKTSLWNAANKAHSTSVTSGIGSPPPLRRTQSAVAKQRPSPEARASATSTRPSTAGELHRKRVESESCSSATTAAGDDQLRKALWSGEASLEGVDSANPSTRGHSRPLLRFIRTGKEHQCWTVPTLKECGHHDDAEESMHGLGSWTSGASGSRAHHRKSTDLSPAAARSRSTVTLSKEPEYAESEADSAILEEQATKLKKAGSAMSSAPLLPRWANLTSNSLLAQGEAMLEEQNCMDDRRRVTLAMRAEGEHSVTRKVLTTNIKHRLRDESGHEAKGVLDCHYHCASIRKSLVAMSNARRDLGNVTFQARRALGEEEKVDYADKFGFMKQAL